MHCWASEGGVLTPTAPEGAHVVAWAVIPHAFAPIEIDADFSRGRVSRPAGVARALLAGPEE